MGASLSPMYTPATLASDETPARPVRRGLEPATRVQAGRNAGILDTIAETNDFTEDTEQALEGAYDTFLDQFETSDGQSIKAGKEEHEALPEDELEQEQIVKQKRG